MVFTIKCALVRFTKNSLEAILVVIFKRTLLKKPLCILIMTLKLKLPVDIYLKKTKPRRECKLKVTGCYSYFIQKIF